MASLTYMELLRGNRSFRRLWAGQVVSELGNWFNFIAGLGLVRAVSSAAPEAAAIFLVAHYAAFALLAPLAGAFVDRWPRRKVMLVADIARAFIALGFLLVRGPQDLWFAYVCAATLAGCTAFFDAAKNASLPNVTGDKGLLAGNALMFSWRFLLMAVGAALGGAAAARFGYEAAFLINSVSFLVSAFSVWLIPARDLQAQDGAGREQAEGRASAAASIDETANATRAGKGRVRVFADIREGWAYVARHRLVAALIGVNILWALGGGAVNLIYERLGGVVFATDAGVSPDAAVAFLFASVGAGLFLGMLCARRIGSHVELRGATAGFIGWMIVAHGICFALAGLMPTMWLAGLMIFLSRVIIGMEFAVQETLLMRQLPDRLRGRVLTTDRAAEIMTISLATVAAGWSLNLISPRALTVISGLLSALPGVIWLALFMTGYLRLPPVKEDTPAAESEEETALAL